MVTVQDWSPEETITSNLVPDLKFKKIHFCDLVSVFGTVYHQNYVMPIKVRFKKELRVSLLNI